MSYQENTERNGNSVDLIMRDAANRELARRLREGEREAFAEMMRLHAGGVLRQARSMLGCGADAEDAAQEVFIKAFRHRQGLRGENIRAWLGTITHRQCLDLLARKGRDPILPGEIPEPGMIRAGSNGAGSAGAGSSAIGSSGAGSATDADEAVFLACLTPVEREILLLRLVEELPYREIADFPIVRSPR